MKSHEFLDGKYKITHNDGELKFFRLGEPWAAAQEEYQYSGLILAMIHKIEELEKD